jgi:hypothetical protein
MAKKCIVCTHPQREAIEKALIAGVSLGNVKVQFEGLNKSSLCRHMQHLPKSLIKAAEAKEISRADNLIEEIERLRGEAIRISHKAEEQGDLRTALMGVRELTRIVELMARLRGEIEQQTINIHVNPEWLELRATIINVLEPYPEARIKLAEVLEHAS